MKRKSRREATVSLFTKHRKMQERHGNLPSLIKQHALISPIINKNIFLTFISSLSTTPFVCFLYSHSPQMACPWLLTQIDLLLFSVEHTTIRLSSLNSFVKATDDVPVLNPKLTFLIIFLDPSAEFDTTDHPSSLKHLLPWNFRTMLFSYFSFYLTYCTFSVLLTHFPPIFHQAGILKSCNENPFLFYLSGQISISMSSLYHQDWIYITLYYPELWF